MQPRNCQDDDDANHASKMHLHYHTLFLLPIVSVYYQMSHTIYHVAVDADRYIRGAGLLLQSGRQPHRLRAAAVSHHIHDTVHSR